MPLLPRLRIGRRLGAGGMGTVFLARDLVSHRQAAIKVIASAGAPDAAALVRFHREVEALSAIRHPNVVRLLSHGEVDGVPYAILERVRGRSLGHVGSMRWPVVVDLGRQLAAATEAVHLAGWMHRDLKPGNLMVGAGGHLTVIDFGLAKRYGQGDPEDDSEVAIEPAVTMHGFVVGTRHYLAPEVLHGAPTTPAVDLYAIGMVLLDLLRGGSATVPLALGAVIEGLLDRDPWRRPSAGSILERLSPLPAEPAEVAIFADDDEPTWSELADRAVTCR